MGRSRLNPDQIEAIRGDLATPAPELARKFGISERQIRNYRRQSREERQELARAVVARHVEEHVPDALADLTTLRTKARAKYETTGDSRDGKLWLETIKVTLDKVTPDDADL